jgi:hypothetical protein
MIFLIGEIAMIAIFYFINLFMNPTQKLFSLGSIVRGVLERGILYVGLIMDYASIIMFFAALKLGTRLEQDKEKKISNDYFLVGNLISMGAVLLYIFMNQFISP